MKISRWQVFKPSTGDVVICKNCEEMLHYVGREAPEKLPRRCPYCGAIMIGRTCIIPPRY